MQNVSGATEKRYLPAIDPKDVFLLGLLLQANSQKNGWQRFLNAFCQHFGLRSAHLYIAIAEQLIPIFQECAGVQPSDIELKIYIEKYFQYDLTHLAILNAEPHRWLASNLMPNREEVESSPAYDWGHKNNIFYAAGTTLFRDTKHTCVLVHNRSRAQGEYTPDEIKRFEVLSPYIENAMKMRLELSSNNDGTVYIQAALNKMRLPVAVLSEFGELIAQNKSMEGFIKDQSQLMIAGGTHLRLQNENINKAFQSSITQTVSTTKAIDLGYSTQLVPIERDDGKKAFLGVDSIIEEQAEKSTFRGALVYVLAPEVIGHLSAQSLKAMFRLTGAESRVCELFSQLLSAKEIAYKEGKSLHTVREQLRTIFEKTGVSNQIQLINLLASIPAPQPPPTSSL